jgi:hypothetical protein
MASLIDFLSLWYAPIQSGILSYLRASDVSMVSRTSRYLSGLWKTFVATAYNINHNLRGYFDNPNRFRTAQSQCDAVKMDDWACCFCEQSDTSDKIFVVGVTQEHVRIMAEYFESED